MFEDLFDSISKLFSWRWPTAEGVIIAIRTKLAGRGKLRLAISYEFSVGTDGPYTGEDYCGTRFFPAATIAANKMLVGKAVTVRYRPNDPSINTLDPGQWQSF